MRLFVIAFIMFCFSLTAPAQKAEAQNASGLSYSATPGKSYSKNTGKKMRYRARDVSAFQKAEPAPTTQAQENESNTGQEIWEKYRALVGGEETKKESPKDGTIPVKDIPKLQKKKTEPDSARGLGGILQQYRNQQKSRHQMRSLQIHKAQPAQEAAE